MPAKKKLFHLQYFVLAIKKHKAIAPYFWDKGPN
jgi:hypothetical protein